MSAQKLNKRAIMNGVDLLALVLVLVLSEAVLVIDWA